jgi:hypothetical protein
MQLVPMDQDDPIKPGIYFITAESIDFNAALGAVQENLNSPQFLGVTFIQLVATQKMQLNKFNNVPEILHCIVAVIKINEDRSN